MTLTHKMRQLNVIPNLLHTPKKDACGVGRNADDIGRRRPGRLLRQRVMDDDALSSSRDISLTWNGVLLCSRYKLRCIMIYIHLYLFLV